MLPKIVPKTPTMIPPTINPNPKYSLSCSSSKNPALLLTTSTGQADLEGFFLDFLDSA